MRVIVCLYSVSQCISRKPRGWILPKFLCVLPEAVARFTDIGVAMCYVLPVLWMTNLLTVLLEINYLRIYWTNLNSVFRIGRHVCRWTVMALFFRSLKGRSNQFWGQIVKFVYPIFIRPTKVPKNWKIATPMRKKLIGNELAGYNLHTQDGHRSQYWPGST